MGEGAELHAAVWLGRRRRGRGSRSCQRLCSNACLPAPAPAAPPWQAVMAASGKRFTIDRQGDPLDFLSWLVNSLHTDLTGGKRKKRSGALGVGLVWTALGGWLRSCAD